MKPDLANIGRVLLAMLFIAGAIQKAIDPEAGQSLLSSMGLPVWLIFPAMLFNACAGMALLLGMAVRWVALSLALYCVVTSLFHFQPSDGWQMSIFIKNWAITGGLLVLADHPQTSRQPK